MNWCSFSIFYHTGQNGLLLDCVEPLVLELRAARMVTRVFFLRHWREGPHVRLRLLVPDDSMRQEVVARVRTEVARYLARSPSPTKVDERTYKQVEHLFGQLEGDHQGHTALAPNNSLRVESYAPEYTKYGGARGVAIAERLFEASTQSAFLILPELQAAPARKLGAALLMTLIGLRHFGLPPERMPPFFERSFAAWSQYVVGPVVQVWERKLEAQLPLLRMRALRVLAGESASHPAFLTWAMAAEAAAAEVQSAGPEVLGALELPGKAFRPIAPGDKWEFMLFNYLHTHANRLGLLPGDEAYLAFLGGRVLRSIVSTPDGRPHACR